MKKLSLMFLLLVAGLYFTACGDDSDVPANGYMGILKLPRKVRQRMY